MCWVRWGKKTLRGKNHSTEYACCLFNVATLGTDNISIVVISLFWTNLLLDHSMWDGMVHAREGQKLVKSNKITSFLGDRAWVLDTAFKSTNYYKPNTETTCAYVILIFIPHQQIILTLIKPFSFVWYVIPLLKTGALAPVTYFYKLTMKKLKKNKVGLTNCIYRPQYLPGGGV